MMKYKLEKRVLNGLYILNLRKVDFDKYFNARNIILMSIYIEEAFDVLIDNYLEFESTLLQSTNHFLIRFIDDHETFQSERRLFNRKLINLLTTGRAYLDQTCHHLSSNFGENSPQYINFKVNSNSAYDTHFGFRVIEALRNYVQHRGWPIHGVTYHSQLIGDIDNARFLFVITPIMNIEYLKEDKKFKPKKILCELELIEKKKGIDLRPIVRDYIEAITNIHDEMRTSIQEYTRESERLFNEAIKRFQKNIQL